MKILILFMMAQDDLASKQRGHCAGIDDYIVRPIDLDELLSCPNRAFTCTQLMDEFWSVEPNIAPRAVNVYITKLRDKFSLCGTFEIVTVHGLGYKAVVK